LGVPLPFAALRVRVGLLRAAGPAAIAAGLRASARPLRIPHAFARYARELPHPPPKEKRLSLFWSSLFLLFCIKGNIPLWIYWLTIEPEFKMQMRPIGHFPCIADDGNRFASFYEITCFFEQF
jgi:hypothetical protein